MTKRVKKLLGENVVVFNEWPSINRIETSIFYPKRLNT